MKTISFSHHYPKLHGQVQAKLLAVIPLPGREISEPLLEYDTTFNDTNGEAIAYLFDHIFDWFFAKYEEELRPAKGGKK